MTTTGRKLWLYKFRFHGAGKQMSYGQYPDVPLVNARDLHDEARRLLTSGVDPAALSNSISSML
ncbi:Arm DNA-binding domain-containing protein [Granulicella arctica]|uniref:Arm DNA-binding domain-containing protein n=1 Tax=Granulicella arctica TaxID=940613 RepID=UPI0037C00A18